VHLFGLTGGIASGKSVVAARFRERGLPVIDADALAREVVAPGTDGLREIVAAFGAGVVRPDGSLDRKAVAALVFGDSAKRRALNAITHPRITALTLARSQELASQGHALACYEAALIVENGAADAFRPLVVVTAPLEVQVARAVARDGCTEDDARARIASQTPLDAKVALADFVIENTGTLEELRARADAALDGVCSRLGIDTNRYAARGTIARG
jgi:dephospho-CoA kinase